MTRLTRRWPILLCSILFFLNLIASFTVAQSRWVNPAGGFWDSPGNWFGGAVPIRAVTATFDRSETYNVDWDSITGDTVSGDIIVDNGDVTFRSLGDLRTHTIDDDGSSTLVIRNATLNLGDESSGAFSLRVGDGVEVRSGGTLNVGFGSRLTTLGTRSGSSVIRVQGSGSDVGLLTLNSGAVASTEFVTIIGSGDESEGLARIVVDGTETVLDVSNTLTVGFTFGGQGELSIRNGGTVSAASTRIGIATRGSGKISLSGSGSSLITNQLTVGIDSAGTGTHELVIGAGAVVDSAITEINEFGTVRLEGGRFEFGTMNIEGFNQVVGSAGEMAGMTSNSEYRNIATLVGLRDRGIDLSEVTVTNTGTFHGSAALGNFLFDNSAGGEIQTITGEQMRFGNSGINRANAEINNFGGLVRFEGSLTNELGGFIGGNGTFIANGGISNQGVIAFTGDTNVVGDVDVSGAGQLVTSGFATTTLFDDVIHNGAEIRTSEGSALVILGGATGAGDYTGSGTVFFEGDLRPGNSPDIVSFAGDVVLGSFANLMIELGGTETGLSDQLLIDGNFNLAGSLNVSLIDGFELGSNQQFLFADVDGLLSGQFNGLGEGDSIGIFGGRELFVTYNGFNGNAGVGVFTAVPEPGSLVVLLTIGSYGFVRRRRSEKKTTAKCESRI